MGIRITREETTGRFLVQRHTPTGGHVGWFLTREELAELHRETSSILAGDAQAEIRTLADELRELKAHR